MSNARSDATQETKFVYVTYIRTTKQKLWDALTDAEFTQQYFFGTRLDSTWEKDTPWKMVNAEGKIFDEGEVVENDPPNRRVLTWRSVWNPEFAAEGTGTCTFDLATDEKINMVKLTITHSFPIAHAKIIEQGVSQGWPKILSQLKTLLETGSLQATIK